MVLNDSLTTTMTRLWLTGMAFFLLAKTCFCWTWGLTRTKLVKNQNASFMEWYEEFLFSATAV